MIRSDASPLLAPSGGVIPSRRRSRAWASFIGARRQRAEASASHDRAGLADVVLGDPVRVGELDVDREPLDLVPVEAHDTPALAGGREREKPALSDRQQPVGAVAKPAELPLPRAPAEQVHVAAAHLPLALALSRARGHGSRRLVLACLAVDRVDHRLAVRRRLAQAEQPRERLQVQAVGDADDVDHEAVVLAGEGAQAAAYCLGVLDLGAGWRCHHDAAHGGNVDAFGEDRDVREHARLARLQALEDRVALLAGGCAVERLCGIPAVWKTLAMR